MALTEIQELWAAKLESGEYQQTHNRLRQGKKMCCLGVGCDISGLGKWVEESGEFYFEQSGGGIADGVSTPSKSVILTPAVQEWLGLTHDNAQFDMTQEAIDLLKQHQHNTDTWLYEVGDKFSLAHFNDYGWPFAVIAQIIRLEPPGLFVGSEL